MVIKGNSTAGAGALGKHIQRTDTNERRNEVLELRDVAARDVTGALREMEAVALGNPDCKKPLYHASINTQAHERLTDEQKLQAVDRLEKELGLTGQPRVVVVHEKNDGREHTHIVWSRVRLEDFRVIHDGHNYRKHEIVARELERTFGHERVQGAHIERDGKPRPPRTPSHREHQQAERTGIKPKEAKALITALWREADSGKAFQAALEKQGWILARGDRRDFVAVDRNAGVHSLARRIDGAKAADVRARLSDINPFMLYSVPEAREVQKARQEQARAPTPTRDTARAVKETPRKGPDIGVGVARGIGSAAARIGDSLFKTLLGESPAPKPEGGQPDQGGGRPEEEEKAALRQAEAAASARRQQYLRDFDREVPDEKQRDADIERDRKGGGRERTRGE